MKGRSSNEIHAEVVADTPKPTLQGIVCKHAARGATVHTDNYRSYTGLAAGFTHETVNHRVGEYVRDMVHTQGMESFLAMPKRVYSGVYHKINLKHLQRYVGDFAGRHGVRSRDAIDMMMCNIPSGMMGKRLTYEALIADNGFVGGKWSLRTENEKTK